MNNVSLIGLTFNSLKTIITITICIYTLYELRHEETGFLHMRKTKTQISFAVTAKLISAFVFDTRIV